MTFKIGDKVKDKYTGFSGWVHGLATYITGCNQILINPRKLTSDGKSQEGEWFDDIRVEMVEAQETPVRRIAGGPSRSEASGLRRS